MALSPTAARMQDTLPLYYHENPIVERVLQARANEIDRMDARIDELKLGLIPGAGDDSLRLLSLWEAILALPVNPAGASVPQRQAAVRAGLLRMNAITAADVLVLLEAQLAGGFSITRDAPALLEDTITIHYAEGSYTAATVIRIVQRVWPAHRLLHVRYDTGFLWGIARWDEDEW